MVSVLTHKYFQYIKALDRLKHHKRSLLILMVLDATLAIISNIVDWPWLMAVPRQLILFAPICSLYPLLLFIWLGLFYLKKKIPAWFTTFLFMGLVSYGIMAYLYFPAYMSWDGRGLNLHDVGSIFWVTAYAFQASVIASELKRLPWYQYAVIFAYFFFKDYSDRYLGTFLDVFLDNYPENLKLFFSISIVTLHLFAGSLVLYLTLRIRKKLKLPISEKPSPEKVLLLQEKPKG